MRMELLVESFTTARMGQHTRALLDNLRGKIGHRETGIAIAATRSP
jgi:hypothetical protein